jgi:hypothetical protein
MTPIRVSTCHAVALAKAEALVQKVVGGKK